VPLTGVINYVFCIYSYKTARIASQDEQDSQAPSALIAAFIRHSFQHSDRPQRVLVSKEYSSLLQDDNKIQNGKLKTFKNVE